MKTELGHRSGSKRLRPSKTIGVVIFSFTIARSTLAKFAPFGRDDERFRAFDRFQGRFVRTSPWRSLRLPAPFPFLSDRRQSTCAPSRSMSATSSIATEERISSVSGLKVRPQTAIFLSRKTQSVSRIAFKEALLLRGVDPLHFLQQVERNAELFADRDEGGDVLRKTGAAVADAGVEKIAPDPPVHADAVGDFLDIRAARFADRGDGVDVGNLEREKGIGGVLDQLGAVDIGDENRRHERLVNFLHQVDRALALRADDDPVRVHQVGHGAAFAQEFRIAHDVEFGAVSVVALDRFGDFFAGFHRHGALIDDDAIIGQDAGDFARDFFDETEIDAAVGLLRRRHGDEDDLRVVDAFLDAAGEAQALRGNIAMDDFFQARLVDRHFALPAATRFCAGRYRRR